MIIILPSLPLIIGPFLNTTAAWDNVLVIITDGTASDVDRDMTTITFSHLTIARLIYSPQVIAHRT